MMRRTTYSRGRATWGGFIANPVVQGASVAIILACGIAGGLIVARFFGGAL